MKTSKPWYLSKTILASIITIAMAAAGLVGFPVAGIDKGALSETLIQAITAISGLLAIFGRLSAKERIG